MLEESIYKMLDAITARFKAIEERLAALEGAEAPYIALEDETEQTTTETNP